MKKNIKEFSVKVDKILANPVLTKKIKEWERKNRKLNSKDMEKFKSRFEDLASRPGITIPNALNTALSYMKESKSVKIKKTRLQEIIKEEHEKLLNERRTPKYPPGNHYTKAHQVLNDPNHDILVKKNGLYVSHASISKKIAKELKKKNVPMDKKHNFIVDRETYEKVQQQFQNELDNYIKTKKLYNKSETSDNDKIRNIIQRKIREKNLSVIKEFQSRWRDTTITITGISKGEAQRFFSKLANEIDKDFPKQPKQIRVDF